MKVLMFPLFMIVLCIFGPIFMTLCLKRSDKKRKNSGEKIAESLKKTAQNFVNVRDIDGIFFSTPLEKTQGRYISGMGSLCICSYSKGRHISYSFQQLSIFNLV